jgi:glutamate receptor, ionotropic, invertebrate
MNKNFSSWGYQDNETFLWNGMIGELSKKSSDLGASPLFITLDRIDVIDYIVCTSKTRSKFVFRSPKLSYTQNVFILPFDVRVWISLASIVLIAAFSLCIASKIEWKNKFVLENNCSTLKPSFRESFFLLFCAVCQQGSSSTPSSFGSRLITVVSFITLMFLYASYSANIVALLQSPSNKIRTLEDLYSSRMQLGVDDTIFNHYYFSHADEITRKKIFDERVRTKDGHENFMNVAEGVTKIREGLFAFHMEVGVGYKILQETFQEDEKCGLQEIQYLQVVDPFYAVQKNSTYKEMFKNSLLRMKEYGLHDRENSKFYTKKPKCGVQNGKFVSVGIIDIEPAIMIFIYGFITGILIFIMEKVHFRMKKRMKN